MANEKILTVQMAKDLAKQYHEGQTWGEGSYLDFHLMRCYHKAKDLLNFYCISNDGVYRQILCGVLLHDIVEDTDYELKNLYKYKENFIVETIVHAVTDEPGENRKERKLKTYPKIRSAGDAAIFVKLIDRFCNVYYSDNEKKKEMYKKEYYAFECALRQKVNYKKDSDSLRLALAVEHLWKELDGMLKG